ncbi:MAG: hypothetical protein ACLQT6_16305 [Desulfomonilaceae bacterium]
MNRENFLTENQLDQWVRFNARIAQGVIVELVWRLVAASSPQPKNRRFPLGDSIGQPGPDGILDVDSPFEPFVPQGHSYWEIGTGAGARKKATEDYKDLTAAISEEVRQESVFVFVTPLSGRVDWPHTWKEGAQAKWIEERRKKGEWLDVRVIDGTNLIDWLRQFPSVERWLGNKFGSQMEYLDTPEQRWNDLKNIGAPPPLTPQLFLANRDGACVKLKEVFAGNLLQLKLDSHFPDQVVDFVTAYVAAMDDESRVDTLGRCLLISGKEAWTEVTTQRERHVLVVDFDFDQHGSTETRLLEKARRAGHAVIFRGTPGGIPHPNCETISSPKIYQIKEALEKGGYSEERARILAQKSGGNLNALLRCLQNLSLMPEWAEGTSASELAIAELLGSWSEKSKADCVIVESLSGKSYGEWIGKVREVALRPGTPLTQRDCIWKFIPRYEAWYLLGPRLFDDHLDRLRKVVVTVLRERDPKFELSPDERYAARFKGKVLDHSDSLRKGLAETLALLGSHPKALKSCSFDKAEGTAILAVRETLADADGVLWASLNDLLPLLAEAAPDEFLDAVENALRGRPCPFDEMFTQERSGITGATYMSGLLWALETLAWDTDYLTRVIVVLGELAARDPGGGWTNRPANSLRTILLPWLPQTCAPLPKRRTAVQTLLAEVPDVAWRLLLNLLPQSHSTASMSRKPAWREIIPEDWSSRVTHTEYLKQVSIYGELAIIAVKNDRTKLAELINRLEDLPPPACEQIITYLEPDSLSDIPEPARMSVWTVLTDLVTKHRGLVDAKWALEPEQISRIAAIAERLGENNPTFRSQRLFSENCLDFYKEGGDYEEQTAELNERRKDAVEAICSREGPEAVFEFAKVVESSWRVGIAFAFVASPDAESMILPELLEVEQMSLAQLAGGFVLGRYRCHGGWQWVDSLNTTLWAPSQIGQLLAYLPFGPETWERSARLLGEDESPYWTKTTANPYETKIGLERAIDPLITHGRPLAAIRCLYAMLHDNQPFDNKGAVSAVLAGPNSTESSHQRDAYAIVKIIKALQDDPRTSPDDLSQVEWNYLPLLDQHPGATPKWLERRLAKEPGFFCKMIRLMFRSTEEERIGETAKEYTKNMASNAYRLLSIWKTPPGYLEDGSYEGNALDSWLDTVTKECIKTDHLKMAMTMLGQSLIHAPADPDGLWIHHSAAAVLNAKEARDIRQGFFIALLNSRGIHTFTAGQAEQALAEKYRGQARAVEAAGFHRLAATLIELAKSYEHDAERESSKDPFDE